MCNHFVLDKKEHQYQSDETFFKYSGKKCKFQTCNDCSNLTAN